MALAQGQTTLTGRVVDAQDGSPLGFATVAVLGTTYGAITNAEGWFELRGLTDLDSLRISYVGYVTRRASVADLPGDGTITLARALHGLPEFNVVVDDRLYRRVVHAARKLRKAPPVKARAFFGMETFADTMPVEMMHAYFSASYYAARLEVLELKQGRIGVVPLNDRLYINYNTTRAFALFDVLAEGTLFPASPLSASSPRLLQRSYEVELVSVGSGKDGVDHLRVTPRKAGNRAFALDLWLSAEGDLVRALELSCTSCGKHPFRPLFDHGRIDTVDMRIRQTWSTQGQALPEVMQLDYRMVYSGPGFTETFRTSAVLHAFDRSGPFITPLFEYPGELPDYRKLGWLPEDTAFWARTAAPLPTARQQRDRAFLEQNDLRTGDWPEQLDNKRNFFGAHYAVWSAEKRMVIKDLATIQEKPPATRLNARGTGYIMEPALDPVELVAQLYLDLDTVKGRLVHFSATVLDGFRTHDFSVRQPWTACFHNIWFDLCEVERQAMERRLSAPGVTLTQARAIHSEYKDKVRSMTARYLKETRNGSIPEALFPWNRRVYDALRIDNCKLFGVSP